MADYIAGCAGLLVWGAVVHFVVTPFVLAVAAVATAVRGGKL